MDEQQRLASKSHWYLTDQLDIDKRIIYYRYLSLRHHLVGPNGLELGPAEGEMTQFLLKHFEHLTVVEGAADLLARIPAAPNLEKIHSLFESFAPTRKYNTVLVEHILEHVDDPVGLLKLAAGCCARGGRILAGAPNGNSLHRLAAVKMGLLGSQFELNERDHALGHRRVYSMDLLREHVETAGLAVVEVGGVFLKPLSNSQMQSQWTPAMLDGFYELGKDFPVNAAEIFAVCEPLDR